MPKEISITIRVDEDEDAMLRELENTTIRSRSAMIRYLIREEHKRLFQVERAGVHQVECQDEPRSGK